MPQPRTGASRSCISIARAIRSARCALQSRDRQGAVIAPWKFFARSPAPTRWRTALTAAVALDTLGEPVAGIRRSVWPGRLERVAENPEIVLDGAHNPAGTRALAAYIEQFYAGRRDRRLWLIYGAMRDKAVSEMAAILFPLFDRVIATSLKSARAVRPEAFAELQEHPALRTAATLGEALAFARAEAAPGDSIFIAGSLFLVGEARQLLVK